ncbi:MAG TPA: site-2 protease family protein [Candidatus Dormibacteraeota bacterium]|nr:site-2 protease family protein [Candidatus Dormibacteraeota bacterium]
MSQNDPYYPPQGGEYIPPPPSYQGGSDIPPQSPYHYSPTPQQGNNRGVLGWLGSAALAAWAVVKYGLVFLVKVPAFATLFSAIVSFGAYALFYGPWFAVALVVMIFVHEMGHVLEIRRQGMAATAPIFIPFLGAAIFQRQHPTTAVKQAQIGIAGPIAGTIGATAAWMLYEATQNPVFLLAAAIGFFLNLLNMLPVWQLDGAWVLAPVSPWFQVLGLAAIAVLVVAFHFVSVLLILIAVLGIGSARAAFRNARNPYYTSVSANAKLALGAAWLGLVVYLGVMSLQAESLFTALAR